MPEMETETEFKLSYSFEEITVWEFKRGVTHVRTNAKVDEVLNGLVTGRGHGILERISTGNEETNHDLSRFQGSGCTSPNSDAAAHGSKGSGRNREQSCCHH